MNNDPHHSASYASEATIDLLHLAEYNTDGIVVFDSAGRYLFVNLEAERILGMPRNSILGHTVWELFPDTASPAGEFRQYFERAVASREPSSYESFSSTVSRWLQVNLVPCSGHQTVSGDERGVTLYFRDVTALKQAQERADHVVAELKEANARQLDSLQRSEERFRLLVEGVQEYAIFMLDIDGRITTWNAGAERFKGYKAHEIIGQHFSIFYTAEDIARRHPWNELKIADREGRYEEEGWRIRKDGSRFWASVMITALRDTEGELRGYGKITRDITERRSREQEKAKSLFLEQQRLFLKDVLASVTQGKLLLCDRPSDLPIRLESHGIEASVTLSRQALKSTRTRVEDACSLCRFPIERAQDLMTAVSECAMNAVQHAGGGTAQIFYDSHRGRVQVWIKDSGKGINLSSLPRATLEPGFSTGGGGIGHGFSLMISCSDRIFLLTGPSGTVVVLEKERHAPEPVWIT